MGTAGMLGTGIGELEQLIRIFEELDIVYRNDDGHETFKLVLYKHGYDDYELGEDEHFLDELEHDMDWRHRIDDTESEEDESEEGESDSGDLDR